MYMLVWYLVSQEAGHNIVKAPVPLEREDCFTPQEQVLIAE